MHHCTLIHLGIISQFDAADINYNINLAHMHHCISGYDIKIWSKVKLLCNTYSSIMSAIVQANNNSPSGNCRATVMLLLKKYLIENKLIEKHQQNRQTKSIYSVIVQVHLC